jgi:hypothetical protein
MAHFNPIDHSSILYQSTDDLLDQTILTPFSEQKFDLLSSKADDPTFHYNLDNSLGIYDHYNDSGPSSVHFGDGIEPAEHGEHHLHGINGLMNGNVRPGELHAVPGIAEEHLPISPSHEVALHDIQINGNRNAQLQLSMLAANATQTSRTITMAKSNGHDTPMLDSIVVRG